MNECFIVSMKIIKTHSIALTMTSSMKIIKTQYCTYDDVRSVSKNFVSKKIAMLNDRVLDMCTEEILIRSSKLFHI